MTKADDAQEATAALLELLVSEDLPIEKLITQVAEDYYLKPSVVEAWLTRSFPTQGSLVEWRAQQRVAAENRQVRQHELDGVKSAATDWAMGVWKNCEPDGLPLWPYCCQRFLEANAIENAEHQRASYVIFGEIGNQYMAARQLYLDNQETTN